MASAVCLVDLTQPRNLAFVYYSKDSQRAEPSTAKPAWKQSSMSDRFLRHTNTTERAADGDNSEDENAADDDDVQYDEFGNYVGPDLGDSESDEEDDNSDEDSASSSLGGGGEPAAAEHQHQQLQLRPEGTTTITTAAALSAIVLHEDKEHYPSASVVYGEDVRTAVLDEDAMELSTPIVAPPSASTTAHLVPDQQQHHGDSQDDYLLAALLSNDTTRTRRGIAVVGHLHHGKTSLVDLILEPPPEGRDARSSHRNTTATRTHHRTDLFKAERERQMSLVSTPITAAVRDSRGKTYAVTLLDCPGHPNFHDESVATLRLVDGALLVVDVVEGILLHTELVVKQIISEGLPLLLVLSKLDRLMVELRLPPRDAYFKLLHLVDSINQLIQQVSQGRYPLLHPAHNNVIFASAHHGYIFTLESMANLYRDSQPPQKSGGGPLGQNLSAPDLAARLWGDCYLDPETRRFHSHWRDCVQPSSSHPRTFVQFVLEPLYKLCSAGIGETEQDAATAFAAVGVRLSRQAYRQPGGARVLLREAFSKWLSPTSGGWVDAVFQCVPCPAAAAPAKVTRCYTGPSSQLSTATNHLARCDPHGPLVIHVTKLYYYGSSSTSARRNDGEDEDLITSSPSTSSSFAALGRIYSGTVRPAQTVHVLGENYHPDRPDEDRTVATIEAVGVPRGRTRTPASLLTAGNYVLLEGVDATISKTATLVGGDWDATHPDDPIHSFAPLTFPHCGGEPVVKVSVEPLNPSELPKMVEGLRRATKAYPMARTRVEESGEHVLLGTGELYLDCVLHDLRNVFTDGVELKVSDPISALRETVQGTSAAKCFASTANGRNRLTCIAEPLDDGLAERLETGRIDPTWEPRKMGRYFQSQYDWDVLSARSVWAFGDSPTHGTNLLLDDTLPSEVDKKLLQMCKGSIVQGFQWAMREGPLCEEPVRATKVKILDAVLAAQPIHRGAGQLIPTSRRTVHSSLLTATPRLMEPVYRLEIVCPQAVIDPLQPLLTRRRGHMARDAPIPGSLLHTLKAYVPVLDSFGLETDLRTFTQGQAMVLSVFDHWAVVPGDPLDRSILLHPLEPSPPHHLARELLVKTRRRKGLSEDVPIEKFFDEGMRNHLAGGATAANGGSDDFLMKESIQ